MGDTPVKRRRIVIEDDEDDEVVLKLTRGADDDEVGSNPDDLLGSDPPESEGEGEDLEETWYDDYVAAPELDQYDQEVLADDDEVDETYEDMMRYRKAAERELDIKDARRRAREREFEDNLEVIDDIDQRELDEDIDFEDEEVEEGAERSINLEAFECPLREWIAEERTRREIKRRFRRFLNTYYPNIEEVTRFLKRHEGEDPKPPLPPNLKIQHPIYPRKIKVMCAQNSSSLEISYRHLAETQSLLAIWLTDIPRDMLQVFDEELKQVVLQIFPKYSEINQEVHVRIIDLPLSDKLRDLRQGDLNNLIKVTGVVTRRTGVFPVMKAVAFDCVHCGQILGPYQESSTVDGSLAMKPTICPNCQSSGPFKINNQKTKYGNYQKITIQESPGTVPPGRVPRYKDVILLGDLIDIARPGEEVEVTGIFTHSSLGFSKDKQGFPVFGTVIEANWVLKKNVAANTGLSDEEKRAIKELSTDPQIRERIIRSIAPSIYGHRHIKTAVALSLFGGCAMDGGGAGTHRVRGDINILLLGDPGTAKSQMLKYAEKIAPRSVYTTGKGASAVGLTAGVHKDPLTKEWTLEGGALVLADQGVCLIDEFDKMNEQDRTSIHEAMEQQTISVSKAGIVTSLQARCSVIAAANPIGGRYDPSFAFSENVELTDPILQRFDVLCVLQDTVDPIVDERLATFVVNSHMRSHPDGYLGDDDMHESMDMGLNDPEEANNNNNNNNNNNGGSNFGMKSMYDLVGDGEDGPKPVDQALLKKYITYARAYVRPVPLNLDSEKIPLLYAELRKQSELTGGVPIAIRHLESVVRLSEASAKMCLRDYVRQDDIDLAIKVMLESFLQSQKISVRRVLQRNFRKYITYGEETNQLLMHKLQELIKDAEQYKKIRQVVNDTTEVYMDELETRAKELNIYDLRPFYASRFFKNFGMSIDYENRLIIKTYI